jgi:hypothetical protein
MTIDVAEKIIRRWTVDYPQRPTDEQIRRAAQALVAYTDGPFDLNSALFGHVRTIRDCVLIAWDNRDWPGISYWIPEDVRSRAAKEDKIHILDALLSITDEMYPGYLDQKKERT